MLEMWMLIPTVTGLPETQTGWVRTIFKPSSLICNIRIAQKCMDLVLSSPTFPEYHGVECAEVMRFLTPSLTDSPQGVVQPKLGFF